MKKDNAILWIFLHPPRTGGNTIIETILKKFPREEIFMTSLKRYDLDTEKFDKNKVRFMLGHATYYGIHNLVPDKQPKYFVILRAPVDRLVSHYNFKMQEEKKKIPFDEWYKNQIKNEMVHFLSLKFNGSESSRIPTPRILMPIIKRLNYKSVYFIQTIFFKILRLNKPNKREGLKKLEDAKKLLDLCWFVGVAEKSKEDFKFILTSIGIKNPQWINDGVSKKIIKINEKLRQKIYNENPLDVELYNYAIKLREKKLAEIKNTKK